MTVGLKATGIQIGQNPTATQNFCLTQNADGTCKLARGNDGATTQDVLKVNADGGVTHTQGAAFSAYLPTTAQSVTSGTPTKPTLSAKEFDVTAAFDAVTNYRFQPTVAGYYRFEWAIDCIASGTSITTAYAALYKNGALFKLGTFYNGAAVVRFVSTGSATVFLNGSTDYVELFGVIGATSPQFNFAAVSTYLSGSLVRGA